MRDLIRPTLFVVARLGLFFAVVAWVMGQWWNISISVPLAFPATMASRDAKYCVIDAMLNEDNWMARRYMHTPWPGRLTFSGQEMVEVNDHPHRNYTPKSGWFLGFNAFRHRTSRYFFFRHWLIVTILALFNVVLMWVYRKHGKELAADE